MADNLPLMQGSGAQLSTDDIDGVHVLRAKVQVGDDGEATDVSGTNPLPVTISGLGSVQIVGPLPAGTNPLGRVDVASLPALPPGENMLGRVAVSPMPSGGVIVWHVVGLGASGVLSKSCPGQVYGWCLSNTTEAGAYLKLFDTERAPVVGEDVPYLILYLPAGATVSHQCSLGIAFSRGIGMAATAGPDELDTEDPSQRGSARIVANIFLMW